MDTDPLDMDMGDDEQADEIREYERYIEDPPHDLDIADREDQDEGRLGIEEELEQEWTERDGEVEDNRPAEVAAVEIVNDDQL
ncbi:hypothetical protein D5S18_08280 [Nocardia panacis]|uniref:Uncharacterized protein n=1 Tax=Nocardia panacis TaxID=2340916 RepID=A0A3A4JYH6_9NOCA|nr:hypothetical protein [Nocardia panacis]RJO76335.1 hypothetical protein D5S18_08280 [Nocardia panacis]